MASYKKGKVARITKESADIIKAIVEIDGAEAPAVAYPRLTGGIEVGAEVIVNTTAIELDLGSGGFHIIVWNLNNGEVALPATGHIMKLRYTPLQFNVTAVEEQAGGGSDVLADFTDLSGLPVIIGTLHSQLAPAAAVLKLRTAKRAKVAYVMTDGAALPIALSDSVRNLKEKGLIDVTITIGQAFGGDLEAVNIFSGLAAAKAVAGVDAVIVTMGVGVVGTDTFLGFSGIEQGETVNAVYALRGRPIAVPRLNFQDPRPRHKGLSEQTIAALMVAALAPCDVPVPRMDHDKTREVLSKLKQTGLSEKHRVRVVANDGTAEALKMFGLKPTTMGRDFETEPEFFRAAGAAGTLAAEIVNGAQR